MHIAITGSSGLVGGAIAAHLRNRDVSLLPLVRRSPQVGELQWDPVAGRLDATQLANCDAVIHLAGENIAAGRWNQAKKRRIRESRLQGTRLLCSTLAAVEKPPRVLLAASAIGYYGDAGDQLLDEQSPSGNDFLAEVCRDWEAATEPAREAGIRVVNLRIGVVLAREGGALPKILPPFRLGAGGRLGSGRQYWSWIAIDDLVGVLEHALDCESLSGPVNAVAPHPVTNLEFTKILGKVLRRPTLFPFPAPLARLLLGEMADALLLASTRVSSRRLEESGFAFQFSQLEPALRALLENEK
jgi:uncharacterized protein (TIGR01777 family)